MSITQLKTHVHRPRLIALAVAASVLASLASVTPAQASNCQLFDTCTPVNTAPPTITGQPIQGQTLSTSNGTWTNPPSAYAYAWQDWDATASNCQTITGATAKSYTLKASDVGHTIRSLVTALQPQDPVYPSDPMAPSAAVGKVALAFYFGG